MRRKPRFKYVPHQSWPLEWVRQYVSIDVKMRRLTGSPVTTTPSVPLGRAPGYTQGRTLANESARISTAGKNEILAP